jgi:hypothetical protein
MIEDNDSPLRERCVRVMISLQGRRLGDYLLLRDRKE